MLRSGTIIMIREKAQTWKSAYAIGKELGISKNTPKKYLQLQGEAPAKIDRPSNLDAAYKPLLHKLMDSGIFNCVVLLERLQVSARSFHLSSAIFRLLGEHKISRLY